MTYDRAEQALSRAQRDYRRAVAALMQDAISERARARHARTARVAEGRMRDARRALAQLACEREAA